MGSLRSQKKKVAHEVPRQRSRWPSLKQAPGDRATLPFRNEFAPAGQEPRANPPTAAVSAAGRRGCRDRHRVQKQNMRQCGVDVGAVTSLKFQTNYDLPMCLETLERGTAEPINRR